MLADYREDFERGGKFGAVVAHGNELNISVLVCNRAQFRHDLIVRDAGPGIGQGRLHLRAEPSVISLGFLGRRELGLNGGEFGHGPTITRGQPFTNRETMRLFWFVSS